VVTAKDVILTFVLGLVVGFLYSIACDVNDIRYFMVEPSPTPVTVETQII
jgi:hypothetical protein